MIDWNAVAREIHDIASWPDCWRDGQDESLRFLAQRLPLQNGVLLADEVGLGKTRVALAVLLAVLRHGGNAAVVVPPGLIGQWQDEWIQWSNELGEKAGFDWPEVGMLRHYRDLFAQGDEPKFPLLANDGTTSGTRWLLISQTFNLMRIHSKGNDTINTFAYQLPLLLRHALVTADRRLGNPAYGTKQFLRNNGWQDCLSVGCPECDCQPCSDRGEGTAVTWLCNFCRKENHKLRRRMIEFDSRVCLKRSTGADSFNRGGCHRDLFQACIGHLIGPIDLLVIDEVHKGRDIPEAPSLFGELLSNILQVRGKRLALTATPIELNSDQWMQTLKRCGLEMQSKSIEDFRSALEAAERDPDHERTIRDLIDASSAFQKALAPLVTRRRRADQAFMKEFAGKKQSLAHPHRHEHCLQIDPITVDAVWRPAIAALEGIGIAAKGSGSHWRQLRRLDTTYASGHLGRLVAETETDEAETEMGTVEKDTALRIGHWLSVYQDAIQSETSLHPRVMTMANRIEIWAWREFPRITEFEGDSKSKILVFGTYTKPMRDLAEILNCRAALRLLDKGLPVPGLAVQGKSGMSAIDFLYQHYLYILRKPERVLAFEGGLKNTGKTLNPDDFAHRLKEKQREYAQIRDRIGRAITSDFVSNKFLGNAAINQFTLHDHSGPELLSLLLRDLIVTDLILGPHAKTQLEAIHHDERSQVDALRSAAIDHWGEILDSLRDPPEELESLTPFDHDLSLEAERQSERSEQLQRWNVIGDNLTTRQLEQIFIEEGMLQPNGQIGQARMGDFARLLYGGTPWETRRRLQARFNRATVYPRVLIAQSLVGREGLNLHRQCNHIMLLHPEWNPGVVEQQIGRVDRIDSLWERRARLWMANGCNGPKPVITVERMLFAGTYDAHQHAVLQSRRRQLKAQLFGELLSDEACLKAQNSLSPDLLHELAESSPNFCPRRYNSGG